LACLFVGSPSFADDPPRFADPDLVAEAVHLARTHRYTEALLIYETLLAFDPLDPDLLYEAGSSYYGLGDFDTCVTYGMKARQISRDQFAYDLLGRCLDALGNHETAELLLREGVEEYPEEARMRMNLAITLVQRGDRSGAEAQVETAVTVQPSHSSSHQFLSMAYREKREYLPGILALLGHLSLEDEPGRMEITGGWLANDLSAGIYRGHSGNVKIIIDEQNQSPSGLPFRYSENGDVELLLEPDFANAEGFRTTASAILALAAVPRFDPETGSSIEAMVRQIEILIERLPSLEARTHAERSSLERYEPLFTEILAAELLEPWVRYCFFPLEPPGNPEWLHENQARVGEVLTLIAERWGTYEGIRKNEPWSRCEGCN